MFPELLTICILFSTAINVAFVAKPQILGNLFSICLVLALSSIFLTIPLVSGIFVSKFDLSASYLVFEINLMVSILFTLATSFSYSFFSYTVFS